jgi:hypothetical protein
VSSPLRACVFVCFYRGSVRPRDKAWDKKPIGFFTFLWTLQEVLNIREIVPQAPGSRHEIGFHQGLIREPCNFWPDEEANS